MNAIQVLTPVHYPPDPRRHATFNGRIVLMSPTSLQPLTVLLQFPYLPLIAAKSL